MRFVRRQASKLYTVTCADPPWEFNDKLPGDNRGADKNYDNLSTEDIIHRRGFSFAFPAMAESMALVIWRVSSQVEAAYATGRAWGGEPKSEIIWRKLTVNGKRHFGMGHTVRAEHETAVIFTRGRLSDLISNKGVRSVYDAPVPVYKPDHPKVLSGDKKAGAVIHSGKPESFYTDVIMRLFRGPYVELFARPLTVGWKRTGWDCFGNELEGGASYG